MTTILVTGATGTVGSEVTRALAHAGAEVRVGVRDPSRAPEGTKPVRFDWTDPSSFPEAFAGVDRAFLLLPFVEDMNATLPAALDAAKEAGVAFLLKMSAVGAAPDAKLALARQHAAGEAMVAESGIPYAVIQPTFFQDNIFNYQGAALASEGAFFGASAGGKSSWISARDIGEVAAAILQGPEAHYGKTHVLTGGEALADTEVAALLSAVSGRSFGYVDLTPEQLAAGMEQQGLPGWMIDALVGLEKVKAAGWAEGISPAVQEILGREPESFRAYLERSRDRIPERG